MTLKMEAVIVNTAQKKYQQITVSRFSFISSTVSTKDDTNFAFARNF